jgi:hypothetical protein
MSQVHSGPRRVLLSVKNYVLSSVNVEYDTRENNVVRMEVDNHADTACFGSNFMLAYYTGKDCDVATYSEECQAMHDISVVGAYTAYDDPETGLTYILDFHQGLWFGSRLKNLLWNPISQGLLVCLYVMTCLTPIMNLVFMILCLICQCHLRWAVLHF